VGKSHHSYLVEAASEAEVRALTPDHSLLARLDLACVIVTARAVGGEYDFVSRFFAPSHGIAEDPATGSAHCALGPYWSERLGKTQMTGYQASQRGGVVQVQVNGDRVTLGGQAVTVARCRFLSF
jgi:PhzF family phenazine biosynthesis protein